MKKENAKGKWSMSQRLQFAAFAVASVRFMSMGAMALGTDLVGQYWPFFWLEVVSWLGFAVLEGYAIPYIAKGWRKFERGSFERKQLVAYRVILLLAIPLLGAPYYVSVSSKALMVDVLHPIAYWLWAFLFAGIGALIIDAVGTVESVNEPEVKQDAEIITIRKGNNGPVAIEDLAKFYADTITKRDMTITPDQFAIAFEQAQGVTLTTTEAEAALAAARNGNGRHRKAPA